MHARIYYPRGLRHWSVKKDGPVVIDTSGHAHMDEYVGLND